MASNKSTQMIVRANDMISICSTIISQSEVILDWDIDNDDTAEQFITENLKDLSDKLHNLINKISKKG